MKQRKLEKVDCSLIEKSFVRKVTPIWFNWLQWVLTTTVFYILFLKQLEVQYLNISLLIVTLISILLLCCYVLECVLSSNQLQKSSSMLILLSKFLIFMVVGVFSVYILTKVAAIVVQYNF